MNDFSLGSPLGLNRDGTVAFSGQSDRAFVQFYARAVKHGGKSLEVGAPQFVQKDYVKVIFPGEKDFVDREVKENDKYRWPQQWAAYQQGREQMPEGTPLAVLFPINPEIVENLRSLKFQTVEQLANATDTAIQSIGLGGREWNTKAKKFLEAANGAAGFHKITRELEDAKLKNDQLEKLVRDLSARLEVLEAEDDEPMPRRRGRPPKVMAE